MEGIVKRIAEAGIIGLKILDCRFLVGELPGGKFEFSNPKIYTLQSSIASVNSSLNCIMRCGKISCGVQANPLIHGQSF
jgi:hypothetical protein